VARPRAGEGMGARESSASGGATGVGAEADV
jgi:hypothetical protein